MANTVKWSFIVLVAALVTAGLAGAVYAFHDGGVARCTSCHTMHSAPSADNPLLVASDASSTCLSCHEHAGDTGPSSYHVSTAEADLGVAPLQRSPGGDFAWLKKSFTLTRSSEPGYTHGHNIIAADKNYVADSVNTQAPGGTFLAANLACTSCHNPHGVSRRVSDESIVGNGPTSPPIIGSGSYNDSPVPGAGEAVGVYRLLGAKGYEPSQGFMFDGPPQAVAPHTYNRTEAATETRVAYGDKSTGNHVQWGQWCGTCHPNMTPDLSPTHVHPADQGLGTDIASMYNAYIKTGDKTGDGSAAFTSLVPFIEHARTYVQLAVNAMNDNSKLQGPVGTDKVSCVTCHRAHASGFQWALRWGQSSEYITEDGAYLDEGTKTAAVQQAAYYDRPPTKFGTFQRSLCNKCHGWD